MGFKWKFSCFEPTTNFNTKVRGKIITTI